MTREIKFRALTTTQGRIWHYSDKFGLADFFYGMEDGQLDRETLGQYTGLKDRSGKEIYEGDILQMGKARMEIATLADAISLGSMTKDCEIIGNIYQHPELME